MKDKICCRCRDVKDISEYTKDKSRVDGLCPVCKSCKRIETKKYSRSAYNKEYFKTDKGRYTRFIYNVRYSYGIDEESFRVLVDSVKGICPVCLRGFTFDRKGSRMVIDHCHKTETIRGVLCSDCNSGLGKIGDTKEAAERLLDYIRRDPIEF